MNKFRKCIVRLLRSLRMLALRNKMKEGIFPWRLIIFTKSCVMLKRKVFPSIRLKLTVELPMSLVWEELINTSNLASAIANLYNSIIHNKVAFIDLNNSVELAFHVKQISQISSLPELCTNPFNENNIPLLSTAYGFGEKEEDADQVLAPKY